ncbi:MAG: helix-turn-helix transcriptional regulator [Cytophagaceae bacterium]|nr:helix-turn-helix transcriptional regulator [Cytophagaceae bacterium]
MIKNIKLKITSLREASGLTQEQLGHKVGVKKQQISYYENGTTVPPIEKLQKIADIFNVHISYFFVEGTTNYEAELEREKLLIENQELKNQLELQADFIALLREKVKSKE